MEVHNHDVKEQKSSFESKGFDPDKRVEPKANEQDNKEKATDKKDISETKSPIKNKGDGLAREKAVHEELSKQYPPSEKYVITPEAYLRDSNGKIVKDPKSGEARRIDFVVSKDGVSVKNIEVTSETADKTEQMAKESRIRENGGNYIKDANGNSVRIPDSVETQIDRRK